MPDAGPALRADGVPVRRPARRHQPAGEGVSRRTEPRGRQMGLRFGGRQERKSR